MIRAADLIERKRNGEELSDEEISELVLGYTRGDVPDYQMAAWCMAVYFKGLSGRETHALTDAMIRSGDTLDLAAALGRRVVDKHSTGGVGDKTSLAVGPIVAACGVPLGKMSGRGLGHTGGTLDKLESIPGFRVELTIDEFVEQVREIGVAIIGQTGDLVPADKKLYALRDVTATVDIVPLIASSIMSKKLAAGAEAMVLDVKVGDGAFMKTLDDARILAEQMVDLGTPRGAHRRLPAHRHGSAARRGGRQRARGPRGGGDDRGRRPAGLHRARRSTRVHGCSPSPISASTSTRDASARSRRWQTARRARRTSAGSARRAAIPTSTCSRARPSSTRSRAPRAGVVTRLAALPIGIASLELGGGRRTKEDAIDHSVGVVCSAKRGQTVEVGQVLADVHARDEDSAARAVEAVAQAYEIGDEAPPVHGILLDVVEYGPGRAATRSRSGRLQGFSPTGVRVSGFRSCGRIE